MSQNQQILDRRSQLYGEVLGLDQTLEAKRCLLNVWGPTDLSSKDRIWATLGHMVVKRNIARMWGASEAPGLNLWKKDMDWCMFREKNMSPGDARRSGLRYGPNGMSIVVTFVPLLMFPPLPLLDEPVQNNHGEE